LVGHETIGGENSVSGYPGCSEKATASFNGSWGLGWGYFLHIKRKYYSDGVSGEVGESQRLLGEDLCGDGRQFG